MLTAQRLLLKTALRQRASAASIFAVAPRVFQLPLSTLAIRKPATASMALARRPPMLWSNQSTRTAASSTKSGASPATSSAPASASSTSSAAKTGAERRQEMVEKGKSSWGKLKDLWQKYGMVSVVTYFSMYGVVLSSMYVAIEQGWLNTSKPAPAKEGEENPDFNLVTATNKCVCLLSKKRVIECVGTNAAICSGCLY